MSITGGLDVLLVDDHQLLSESLALTLRARGLTALVAELGDRDRLLEQARTLAPALVLLDLDLGGCLGDGVTLVRPFHDAGCAVLVLTGSSDQFWLGAALEQGAVGARSKAGATEELLADVVTAVRGGRVMSAEARMRAIIETRRRRARIVETTEVFSRLSTREEQVLRELSRGQAVAHIAAAWVVSEATVRSQVRGILTKLDVGSQLEAVALALRVGWVQPPELGYRGSVPASGAAS